MRTIFVARDLVDGNPRVASEPHTTYVTPQEFLAHFRQDDTPVAG
jgi:hypothetical protein